MSISESIGGAQPINSDTSIRVGGEDTRNTGVGNAQIGGMRFEAHDGAPPPSALRKMVNVVKSFFNKISQTISNVFHRNDDPSAKLAKLEARLGEFKKASDDVQVIVDEYNESLAAFNSRNSGATNRPERRQTMAEQIASLPHVPTHVPGGSSGSGRPTGGNSDHVDIDAAGGGETGPVTPDVDNSRRGYDADDMADLTGASDASEELEVDDLRRGYDADDIAGLGSVVGDLDDDEVSLSDFKTGAKELTPAEEAALEEMIEEMDDIQPNRDMPSVLFGGED